MTDTVEVTPDRGAPARTRWARLSAVMIALAVALGLVQAVVWAWLAPGVQQKVYMDGQFLALPTESNHLFADVALFVLIGVVVGVTGAVSAWRLRQVRGAHVVLISTFAHAVGAMTAYVVGRMLVDGVDPASIGPGPKESIVTAAPALHTVLVVLAQPALAAAVYTFLAAWNGLPGLGRAEPTATATPTAIPGQA